MRGKFIVFEGIDGCGKGAQIKRAGPYIFDLSKEYDCLTTREPTRDFKEIRQRMAQGTDVKKDAEWYAKMFVADRRNHVEKYIQYLINLGTHVLTDRYKHSTLAYQHTQGIELSKLIEMHEGFLVPDLTLIFDCPAKLAFQRRRYEGATDVFDKDLEFQESLRKNYLKLKDILEGENIVIIDGSKPIDEVFSQTKEELDKILKV